VLIASRVNRAAPLALSTRAGPRVVDEVLADVRLDESSLRRFVESINSAAGQRVVRLDTNLPGEAMYDDGHQAARALRGVRLGRVLAIGNRLGANGVEWREERDEVVIGGAGTAPATVEGRLYDVRDIAAEADAWTAKLHRAYKGPRPGHGVGIFGSKFPWMDVEWSGAEIAGAIRWTISEGAWDDPKTGWRVTGAGGWVFVRAGEDGHRKVGQLLALLRRGDSESVGASGGVP
jgi:hypothetical protein